MEKQELSPLRLYPSGTCSSGRLEESSGFKLGVVRLVGTIVGAFVCRNSLSRNRGIAKANIKTEGCFI